MRNSSKMPGRQGFTLIELMIVVAIIGILAAIAIPAFIHYVKSSKTSEAYLNLKALADGSATYYQVDHYEVSTGNPVSDLQFPGDSGVEVVSPADVPLGGKALIVPSDWDGEPWAALRFVPSKSHYYQYKYISVNGATTSEDAFEARAVGDLDGDGIQATFLIDGVGLLDNEMSVNNIRSEGPVDPLE